MPAEVTPRIRYYWSCPECQVDSDDYDSVNRCLADAKEHNAAHGEASAE